MIEILEHGKRKVVCPNCEAKLQYVQGDVICEKRPNGKCWITCPDCGNKIILTPIKR